MLKHAYLIIANQKFNQLKFLLRTLDDSQNDIYLLIDKKSYLSKKNQNELLSSVRYSRINIYHDLTITWGDYSQIVAELYLFKKAISRQSYFYYHLLSGQDLPLYSQSYIHSFFLENPDKIFLTIPSQEIYDENKIPNRVKYDYYFIPFYGRSNLGKYSKLFFKLLEHSNFELQKLFGKTRKREKDLPYIGYASNWVSLNENAVYTILSQEQEIKYIFSKSYLCDELFIPTILFKDKKFQNELYYSKRGHDLPDELQGNLRYINWWDGSPYTWTDNDIDQIKNAREMGHLFSRKFDLEKSPNIKKLISSYCFK